MEHGQDDVAPARRRRSKRQMLARAFRRLRICGISGNEPGIDEHLVESPICDIVATSATIGQHTEQRRSRRNYEPVVKNTFLQVAIVSGDTGSSPELPVETRRARAQTDTALEYTEYGMSESESVTGRSHLVSDDIPSTVDPQENILTPKSRDKRRKSEEVNEEVCFEVVHMASFASTVDGFEESQSRVDQENIVDKGSRKVQPMPTVPSSGASSWSSVSSMPSNLPVHSPSWPVGLLPSTGTQSVPLQQAYPGNWPSMGSSEDQNLRAAELEVQAALLKLSALQAEAAARKIPINTPSSVHSPDLRWLTAMTAASNLQDSIDADELTPSPSSSRATPTKLPKAGRKSVGKPKKADGAVSSPVTSRSIDSSTSNVGFNVPSSEVDVAQNTTIMLRHLPPACTRDRLVQVLDSQGFGNRYDFIYLPVDFVKWQNFGYAFVNFVSAREALRSWQHFNGFTAWPRDLMSRDDADNCGTCPCEVSWGDPLQGLEAYVERYRDSPVMHREVPEQYKPLIFSNGVRVPFPAPTKRIRRPRLKLSGMGESETSSLVASIGETVDRAAPGDAAGGFPSFGR